VLVALVWAVALSGCTGVARFDLAEYRGDPNVAPPPSPAQQPPRSATQYPSSGPGWSPLSGGADSEAGLRTVTVQEGDTAAIISQRYGVPVRTLYAKNGPVMDRLSPGQTIVVPILQ
jgi:LysM repeat protein